MGKYIGSATELKSEIWGRYESGSSVRSIDRPSSLIYEQFVPTDGIRPSPRTRLRIALSLEKGEEKSRGIVANLSIREIAFPLGRSS